MSSLADKCGIPIDAVPAGICGGDLQECLASPDIVGMANPAPSGRRFWYYRHVGGRQLLQVSVSYEPHPLTAVRAFFMSTAGCETPDVQGELQWHKEGLSPPSAVDVARFAWAVNRRQLEVTGAQATRQPTARRTPKLRWEVPTPLGRVQLFQGTWDKLCGLLPRLSGQKTEEIVKQVLEDPHEKPKPVERYYQKPPGYLFYRLRGHEEIEVVVGTGESGILELEAVVFVPAAGGRQIWTNWKDRRGVLVSVNRENWRGHVAKHPELALAYPFIKLALRQPNMIAREKSPDGLDFMLYFPPDVMTRVAGPAEQIGGWLFIVLVYSVNASARIRADFKTGYVNGFWNRGIEEVRWNLRE